MIGTLLFYYVLTILILIAIVVVYPNGYGALHYYARFTLYIALVSTMAFLVQPWFLLKARRPQNMVDAGFLLKKITKLMGIKWELRGADVLTKREGGVIVANHQSGIDILGLMNIMNVIGPCMPVAKKQLFYIWPFGLTAWAVGVLFIDRSDRNKSMKTLSQTKNLLQKEKIKLWLFPEGTRNKNALKGNLLPFKKGAFRVAIENQVPVFPMVFSPYYFINEGKHYFAPGRIIVKALKPIPTTGLEMKDMEDLMDRTNKVMQEEFSALRQEVFATLPQDYPVLDKDENKL